MAIPEIIKASIFFFIGYISIIVMNYIIPPVLTAVNLFYSNGELQGIVWFGAVIIWVLLGLVYPLYIISTMEIDPNQRVLNTMMAVLICIMSLAIIIKFWYWIPALADLTTDGFIKALFWTSVIAQIITTTTIVPILIIASNKATN